MVTSVKLDGEYKLEFASNWNFRGSGLVTLKDGKFRGNNQSFEWRGSYDIQDGVLHAEMSVKQFSGGVSIFGLLSEFDLVVSGPFDPRKMTLTGYRKEDPADKVVVIMSKWSELTDPA